MPTITITHVFIIFVIMYCFNHVALSEPTRSIVNGIVAGVLLLALFFASVR